MKKLLFILLALAATATVAMAQEETDDQLRVIYEQAEHDYEIGRIEEAQHQLNSHLKSFSGNLRQSAYRLLTLCSLGLDNEAEAEEYARKLLQENPYYSTTLDDPQRFIDMVESISGRGESTITTASSHEERLSEVPVPTTLITEQMIRDSGARNLQEVLATYVPGMNIVDCNDDINIAMRGIFSNGQEKILIMLNGHRLNSYCTNIAAPDFSISLEKLKQIEVLRGPASSLYGGVALTAVVNLITKKGAEADGVKMRAGYGNYGQLKGNLLFGKRYYDLDILLWGSIYRATGEECEVPLTDEQLIPSDRTVTVGGIGRKPSFDVGLTLKWKDIQFMYDTQFSQVHSPYTISTFAVPYDYYRYRTFNGLHPGYATNSHHANLKYGRQIGKVSIDGSLSYENADMTHYQTICDDTLAWFGEIVGLGEELSALFRNHRGTSRYINGQEQSYGAQVKGDYNYIANGDHSGYLTFGAEYSHFQLNDVNYNIVYDFTKTTPANPLLAEVGKGSENNYNAFLQLKHRWNSFIFNAGLRYDHKVRFDYSRVNELSPRLALIYVRPKWNVKLSYSKSFVDAPYLYQKINQFVPILKGKTKDSEESFDHLQPETLNSYQFTFAGTQWLKGLDFELNFFHNRAQELIFTYILDYENSGKNKTIGVELMAGYKIGKLTTNFNATWIHTLKSSVYIFKYISKDIDDNNSTPAIMANLVAGLQATKALRLYGKAAFQGKQSTYNLSYATFQQIYGVLSLIEEDPITSQSRAEELTQQLINLIDNKLLSRQDMSSSIIFDLGAEYRLGNVSLGLDIHNLFNKKYYRSGMNTGLVPQRGRWFMGTISYEF